MRTLRGLVVLLLLTLAGCGTSTTVAGSSPDGEAVESSAAATLDFTATTLEGESFEGTSLAGSPTVLWFWAPWCPTCRAQIPTVSGLGEEYAGRVDVVAVGGLDTQDEIEELAGEIGHVTHLVDEEGVVWKHFGVTAQSTYTVLDADGEIVHEGYLDNGAIEELVADLAD
ncbi:redoxin family protein [Nocardioides sp.]|uniref:TlpA family protein disulfide reductase n=1 Tax=Nocardioides sp. TaxID=35761 RepID=UPI0027369923|nr:redoxin family protein [Nocardioides sp.]MDP3892252.1 redoxin family protein [Nocardioides sp.]